MKPIRTVPDYFKSYKELKSKCVDLKRFRVAILSSSTINGLKEILTVKCMEIALFSEVYIGGYDQYAQEILDNNSKFYEFMPDLVILFVDIRSLLGDIFFDFYQLSLEERKELLNSKIQYLTNLINRMREKLRAKIVVHNFEVPSGSPLSILENKQELGIVEFVEKINADLRNLYKSDSQVFIFDYNSFISELGKKEVFNYKMYYLADIKIDLGCMPALVDQYIAYIKPLMSMTRKCIVLDLDNTLWGGIIGEDGIEGIKLGPTPEGRPFMEFQKYILSYFNRGIILAINSKNNLDSVLNVLKEHPYMILKEHHFASMQINWNDKISNMKAISKELNIGLDSFVFFDDDKFNREIIRDALPEVKVVDLPEDPSQYIKIIQELNDFNTFQLTEEDKKKGQIYAEQKRRTDLSKSIHDITEYLKGLEMEVTIESANKFNIPRISQLTQKTNQFNMTTRRYLEEDINKFSQDDYFLVFCIGVKDKFGDNGITGTAIVKKGGNSWLIDTFLLSCRVIGRKVEDSLLAYIVEEARKTGTKKLMGEFIPSQKNAPARNFYKEKGFKLEDTVGDKQIWCYKLSQDFKYPEFIQINKEVKR
ncbi:MAG: HAD-IIIC family phosphatase [bacterium]